MIKITSDINVLISGTYWNGDIVTSLALEVLTDLDATSDTLRKEREPSICKKCYKQLQVDEKGQAVIATFNKQGQEISRVNTGGGGGRGGSDFIPDPSGRKDRFGNPVYVPKPEPKPKPCCKPVSK